MNCYSTVEITWLEQAWNYENWFQSKVVPASQGKFLYYKLTLLTLILYMGLLWSKFHVAIFILYFY